MTPIPKKLVAVDAASPEFPSNSTSFLFKTALPPTFNVPPAAKLAEVWRVVKEAAVPVRLAHESRPVITGFARLAFRSNWL